MYLDKYEVEQESIIIGNGGSICVHIDSKFTPSKHVTICQIKDSKVVDIKYLYHFLLSNVDILQNLSAGSTIKWLNNTSISNVDIPIPNLNIQKNIVKEILEMNKKKKT